MYRPVSLRIYFSAVINWSSECVKQPSGNVLSYRYHYCVSGCLAVETSHEAFRRIERNASDYSAATLLQNLGKNIIVTMSNSIDVLDNSDCIIDFREIPLIKLTVYNRSYKLNNFSYSHILVLFYMLFACSAPLTISVSSVVILACLARLLKSSRCFIISSAFSVAFCMAVSLAVCSLAYASTIAP